MCFRESLTMGIPLKAGYMVMKPRSKIAVFGRDPPLKILS